MQMKTIRRLTESQQPWQGLKPCKTSRRETVSPANTQSMPSAQSDRSKGFAAALHAELEQLQRREPALLEEARDPRRGRDQIATASAPDFSEQLRANSVARIEDNVAAIEQSSKTTGLMQRSAMPLNRAMSATDRWDPRSSPLVACCGRMNSRWPVICAR